MVLLQVSILLACVFVCLYVCARGDAHLTSFRSFPLFITISMPNLYEFSLRTMFALELTTTTLTTL